MAKKHKSNLLAALQAGCFKHKRKPGLVKTVRLEKFLTHCPNQSRLCKAIAYSMTCAYSDRQTQEWITVKNASGFSESELENTCVFFQGKVFELSDLTLVDYSILQSNQSEAFLAQFPNFKQILLLELKLIWKRNQ